MKCSDLLRTLNFSFVFCSYFIYDEYTGTNHTHIIVLIPSVTTQEFFDLYFNTNLK